METGSDLGFEITTGELNLTLDCEHAHVSGRPLDRCKGGLDPRGLRLQRAPMGTVP
jgi:hypothetical protein